MNKVIKSALLTVVAVPFLMAAPNAAKKAQNTATSQSSTTKTVVKKAHKKHVKKSQNSTKPADTATSSKK